jgi:hypothetical protein
MTTLMLTQRGLIRSTATVREDFAGKSTGGLDGSHPDRRTGYYGSKGAGVRAFGEALEVYGLQFDPDDFLDLSGCEGRISINVHVVRDDEDECIDKAPCVGRAILSWYRMPSGNYEFTGYLA